MRAHQLVHHRLLRARRLDVVPLQQHLHPLGLGQQRQVPHPELRTRGNLAQQHLEVHHHALDRRRVEQVPARPD
jgi:hypothetical protein